jgi:HPt (histidine-containing phosphotransfer) domain-containing protein/two-component sensor histidine kinase
MLGSLVTCGAGLWGLHRLEISLESVIEIDVQRLLAITELRKRIRSQILLERDQITETAPARAAAMAAELERAQAGIAQQMARYQSFLLPEDASRWSAIEADLEAQVGLRQRVMALSASHQPALASALSQTHSRAWEALIKELIERADARLQDKARATRGIYTTARDAVLGVFALSATLGVAAGLLIYRGIRKAMEQVMVLKDELAAANAGLERTVEERTRTIRAILDHVRFGFFLVGRDMRITDGHTRALGELLGDHDLPGQLTSAALGLEGTAAAWLDLAIEQVFDDLLPEDVTCGLASTRIVRGDRILQLHASAVRDATGQVSQILFGLGDVTDVETAERANRESQTVLAAIRNRTSFRRFVSDLTERFGSVREALRVSDDVRARRELHTIKGNAGCYGLTELASRAHLVEEQPRIELEPVIEIQAEFEKFLSAYFDVLGIDRQGGARESFLIDDADLAQMEALLDRTADVDPVRAELRDRLRRLRLKRADELLGPIGEQAVAVGERLGKGIDLHIEGGAIPLVPERMMPLISVLPHLLRNAVDHGIEAGSERTAFGKPERATLEIGFEDRGSDWRVTVRDDGRGIDTEALWRRAVERGLGGPEKPDHDTLCGLIFTPRLSTADSVSELSGRGEGMGAVAEAVRNLGGRIGARSEAGVGTTITVDIPKDQHSPDPPH